MTTTKPRTLNNLINQLQIPETIDNLSALLIDHTFQDPKDPNAFSLYAHYLIDLFLLLLESGVETLLFITEVFYMFSDFLRSMSNSITTYRAVKPKLRRVQSVLAHELADEDIFIYLE